MFYENILLMFVCWPYYSSVYARCIIWRLHIAWRHGNKTHKLLIVTVAIFAYQTHRTVSSL